MLDSEKVDPKSLPVQFAVVRVYLHDARFLPKAGGGPGLVRRRESEAQRYHVGTGDAAEGESKVSSSHA